MYSFYNNSFNFIVLTLSSARFTWTYHVSQQNAAPIMLLCLVWTIPIRALWAEEWIFVTMFAEHIDLWGLAISRLHQERPRHLLVILIKMCSIIQYIFYVNTYKMKVYYHIPVRMIMSCSFKFYECSKSFIQPKVIPPFHCN